MYRPEQCIRTTLRAGEFYGFPIERIIFEFSEGEYVNDRDHLRRIVESYRQFGFLTALDDFGARYAGLGLLADFQPDLVKLGMHLIRGIDHCPARLTIVSGTLKMCRRLGCEVVAEVVETFEELGYLFAPPVFQELAEVHLSGVRVLDGTGARAA